MKRFCLLLTFLTSLPVFLTYGQYEPGMLTLIYKNNAGEKGLTTYIYNRQELPYKAIWELEDGSRWSVNYHAFDSLGNMIRKYREFSDSLTSEQEFKYNENNQRISESFRRSDGVEGEVSYVYEDGLRVNADCKGLNGWFHGTIEYIYSGSSRPDSARLMSDDQIIGGIYYHYDHSHRLDREIWEFHSGFRQTFEYTYPNDEDVIYRSSNVFIRPHPEWIVNKEAYDYSGQGGGPSYYEYDSENRLVKKTYVRSDGLKTVTSYRYEENGLLKASERIYLDGQTGEFTYTYDEHAHLIRRDFRRSDGFEGSEVYTYDAHGRLVSGEYVNVDTWLTGSLTFKHDRYDRITSAKFVGSENTDGVSADLTFSYDAQGNLVSIHWDFSNGATQTYRFEYRKT